MLKTIRSITNVGITITELSRERFKINRELYFSGEHKVLEFDNAKETKRASGL